MVGLARISTRLHPQAGSASAAGAVRDARGGGARTVARRRSACASTQVITGAHPGLGHIWRWVHAQVMFAGLPPDLVGSQGGRGGTDEPRQGPHRPLRPQVGHGSHNFAVERQVGADPPLGCTNDVGASRDLR